MELKDLVGSVKLMSVANVVNPTDRDANGLAWEVRDANEQDWIFMIFEYPDDGYRSSASPVLSATGSLWELGGCHPSYIRRRVICTLEKDDDILRATDAETGHVWFRVGTDNSDSYYPCFVNEFNAMAGSVAETWEAKDETLKGI